MDAAAAMNPDHPQWTQAWPAPAKLNLFLHVVGRRDDGYHLLQTVFCFIDLADELRFTPRFDGRISRKTPLPGVAEKDDLTLRAAHALRAAMGDESVGVDIELVKRIPDGGGFGGGSSDAATVLLALNQLWGAGLSRRRLQHIGLTLGADVPVFIHGRSCFAEGVGERFTDIVTPPHCYLLGLPAVAAPTARIFAAPQLRRDTPLMRPQDWRYGVGGNDLEAVACALYPPIGECLAVLRRFGDARMSGSGAGCFIAFADEAEALAAQRRTPASLRTLLARGLAEHPLARTGQ